MPDVVGIEQASHNIALPWYDAGCSVVPIQTNGTKRPSRDWSDLQQARMSRREVEWHWREGQDVGVAVICGAVSGNLEMTELEADVCDGTSLDKIVTECRLRGIEDLWDALHHNGYVEWTPSGGLHMLYRITDHEVPGNTKLASMPGALPKTLKTLAETRGEGGYVIVAPTTGACHPSGEAWITTVGTQGVIPMITWSQRMELHLAITAALDQTPTPEPAPPRREIAVRVEGELRPGDDWEAKHDWDEDWFAGLGWTVSHRVGGETFWVRPGKDRRDGHSASTGYRNDRDRLYVFSTSVGLPTETPLTKFFVYSHYHYNGDMNAAAAALRKQGYGSSPQRPKSRELAVWEADAPPSEVALPVQGGLDLTDTGSGRRMKEHYGDKFRYNTRDQSWYEWTGSVWRRDEHKAIMRAAVHCAELAIKAAGEAIENAFDPKEAKRDYANAINGKNLARLNAAISMFAAQDGISITSDAFNTDSNLLNLPNGTYDLESGLLLSHNPADLITLQFGAELDKDAECPKFRSFMEDAIPDQTVRAYVQRSMGYTLLGDPSERTMFMLHGPSGTGKSVLTNLMTMMFGAYGTTAPASTFRLKKQSETLDLHKLRGARFVATSELPEGQLLDEDLVKRLTGGDTVTSRGHWESYTEWRPQCVIWIGTNFLPKVNSDDNAIWRRAKTIRMDTEFASGERTEILGYAKILFKEEANGIFNWLLEGLEAYRLLGLAQPPAVTQDIEAYRTDVDVVACFVRDFLEEGALEKEPEELVKSAVLRNMFDRYCTENHHPPLGARRYQNRLKALGFVPVKSGGVAYWRGLKQNLEHGVLASWR